jgi:hypothetical protein
MSATALHALHRVAREVGIDHQRDSEFVATDICREFHRLRGSNIALTEGLSRANHRLNILEGVTP